MLDRILAWLLICDFLSRTHVYYGLGPVRMRSTEWGQQHGGRSVLDLLETAGGLDGVGDGDGSCQRGRVHRSHAAVQRFS